MRTSFGLGALLISLLMSGCRSAGDITLLVASEDVAHAGAPVYFEVRDDSGLQRAITSARLQESAPVVLKLRDVLDGRRYQARWWVDLDGDGAPSASASPAEPLFEHTLTGTSNLGLLYPRSSWEISRTGAPPGLPPFCSGECGPVLNVSCGEGTTCTYYAAAVRWTCCSKSPFDLP